MYAPSFTKSHSVSSVERSNPGITLTGRNYPTNTPRTQFPSKSRPAGSPPVTRGRGTPPVTRGTKVTRGTQPNRVVLRGTQTSSRSRASPIARGSSTINRGPPPTRGSPQVRGRANMTRGLTRGQSVAVGGSPIARSKPPTNRTGISNRGQMNIRGIGVSNSSNAIVRTPPPIASDLGEIPKPLFKSSSDSQITRRNGISIQQIEYMWKLEVIRGTDLAAKDANGLSDPYVVIELMNVTKSKGKIKTIKTSNKTSTSAVPETLNPVWNFQAYLLPAAQTWENFDGVKFTCYDKDLVGSDDFLGQAHLYFNEDIPGPPTKKQFTLTLQPRPKKKDKISGSITVSSSFQQLGSLSSSSKINSSRLQDPSSLKSAAVQRSALVQLSASGKREIKHVSTNSQVIFGELPLFDSSPSPNSSHGYNSTIALWLVCCCQLAYRDADFIGEVARNVWDMYDYKFIDNSVTDTQGFCMHNDKILIVCFRGTESIRDWMTNLNFVMISSPQFPKRYLKTGVRVHTGFNEALSSVWSDVEGFVNKAYSNFPQLKLYICGHSLGGALANLCFGYFVLSDRPRPVAAVYTVGQPRAGNKKFKEQIELASPSTSYIRITNNQDCVPSLAGGQHCGILVHIKANGEFSFDPPTWQKAVSKAQAMQGSAASLSYAGIADHGTAVYRKRIENHWLKSQFSKSAADDGAFDLCEQMLFLMDFLVEDIKSVKRYKPQFRAIIRQVILSRPFIVSIQDYMGGGVDMKSRKKLKVSLLSLFDSLSKLRKEILARQSKQSVIQQVGSSEKAFNSDMSKLCSSLQKYCDDLHRTMQSAKLENMNNSTIRSLYSWIEDSVNVTPYDPRTYNIQFNSIDFTKISNDMKTAAGEVTHASKHLQVAEELLEEGKYKQALDVLQQISSGKVIGVLSTEDKALADYLAAQAHAKLQNYEEAMNALQSVSSAGMMDSSMMKNSAFASLRNKAAFVNLEKNTPAHSRMGNTDQQLVSKLNNFEIHALSQLFDDADANGDNYLTTQELKSLLQSVGGLENILNNLDWNENVDKNPILSTILTDMKTKYHDAVDLDQFIALMARLMPKN